MWRTEKISFNSQFNVDNVKVLRKLKYENPVDEEKQIVLKDKLYRYNNSKNHSKTFCLNNISSYSNDIVTYSFKGIEKWLSHQ